MSDIDKYFISSESEARHPRILAWGTLIKNEKNVQCEIYRQREGLTFSSPRIYLHYTIKSTGETRSEPEEWDDLLNLWLIDNGIRAISEDNEELRFSLMNRRMFSRVETRYGEGYFNAVLLQVIAKGFGSDSLIAAMLEEIGPGNPHVGRSYQDAVNMIEGTIKESASLLQKLKYPLDIAKRILTGAMAKYLDERFSISNLKMLGWT